MTSVHLLPDKWLPVSIAPSDTDLEVCVIDKHGIHAPNRQPSLGSTSGGKIIT
jgi:hypothetical protein